MATVSLQFSREFRGEKFGPESAGTWMTDDEFDSGDFEEGWRYQLIHGVLVVSPIPGNAQVDPNEQLGHMLRRYGEEHPRGSALDATLPERYVRWRRNRRIADRLIWVGLGRRPNTSRDTATIAVEFVSRGKVNRRRDYKEKRREFMARGIREYWIIDRFDRVMTVFSKIAGRVRRRVVRESETYRTKLLPGFELPLAQLFQFADRWED